MLEFLLIIAQQTSDVVPFLDYINLGVLAALVVSFLTGWVVPGYILKREQTEKEKAQADLKDFRDKMENDILPALWETTEILAQFAEEEKNRKAHGNS